MAAKRITTSSINFVEVAAKIPEAQRQSFNAIKTSTEGLVRRIAALPADKPKLNWDMYRSKIAVPGMVDEFQKKYDALTIPYPKADAELSALEGEERSMRADHEKLVADSKARIAEVNKEVEAWKRMPCPTTMSLEEMCAYGLGGPGGYCTDYKHEAVAFWPYDKDYADYRRQMEELVEAGTFEIDNEKEYEEMKKMEAAAKKS